jgi:anti-sigma regulatory factor (Ser/Thr protein kinase)
MNAIEHGNRNQPDIPVEVEVTQDGADIIVAITDRGGEHTVPGTTGPGTTGPGTTGPGTTGAGAPDLELKLAGEQPPRGWGLFLIRNMVDAMQVSTDGPWHTVQLTMRTGAGAPVADLPGGGQ